MPELSFIPALLAVHWLVTMSPGPNMVLVTQTAVSRGRLNAFAVIAGICASGAVWVTSASLGLKAVFLASPRLHDVLSWIGAGYLVWLGLKLLFAPARPPTAIQHVPRFLLASFTAGFMSNISNPKTLIYFSSLFGTLLPANPEPATIIAAVLVTWTCNFGWYGGLSLLLSGERARVAFSRFGAWLNRISGIAMILFGLRVVTSRPQ